MSDPDPSDLVPAVRRGDAHRLVTGDESVTLLKVRTPAGERLAVRRDDRETRLDALELETLTWQDAAFFADLVGEPFDRHAVDPQAITRDAADLQVANEYTTVRLRFRYSHGADVPRDVDLTAPKLGYGTRVDARVFAALIEKPKTFFSELLRTPYGPEDEGHVHVF